MKRGVKVALLAAALSAGLLPLVAPRTALAYSNDGCNPERALYSPGSEQDGWYLIPSDGNVLGGATVTADTYVDYAYNGDNSSAWSFLLQAGSGGTLDPGGAQVGYQLDASGNPEFFYEYFNSSGVGIAPTQVEGYLSSSQYITAPIAGQSYSYNTLYSTSTGDFTFSIEDISTGTTYPVVLYGQTTPISILSTGGSSPTGLGFYPQAVSLAGETHYGASQMFGDTDNPESLSNSGYWDPGAGGWRNMGLYPSPDSPTQT